jgi:hypothetical protein
MASANSRSVLNSSSALLFDEPSTYSEKKRSVGTAARLGVARLARVVTAGAVTARVAVTSRGRMTRTLRVESRVSIPDQQDC